MSFIHKTLWHRNLGGNNWISNGHLFFIEMWKFLSREQICKVKNDEKIKRLRDWGWGEEGGNGITKDVEKEWFKNIKILPNLPTSQICFTLSSEVSLYPRSGIFSLKGYISDLFWIGKDVCFERRVISRCYPLVYLTSWKGSSLLLVLKLWGWMLS